MDPKTKAPKMMKPNTVPAHRPPRFKTRTGQVVSGTQASTKSESPHPTSASLGIPRRSQPGPRAKERDWRRPLNAGASRAPDEPKPPHSSDPSLSDPVDSFQADLEYLKTELGYHVSFDVIVREFQLRNRSAALIYIDSMVDQTVLTLLMERFMRSDDPLPEHLHSMTEFVRERVPYIEIAEVPDREKIRDQILAGPAALLVEGIKGGALLDVRKYPDRKPDEPSLEKVIRGPRDGFVETLVFNTVLIRRRIRDPHFRIEYFQVGERSKSDVVMMYIGGIANAHFINQIRKRIQAIRVDALTMSEKALEEWVLTKPWWNPFPNARFTERPDVASEHLVQGHVLLMADTSPNAMILPVTLFSFLQSAEEYHEGVMVGSYLKWVRTLAVLFSLVGPPLWYALYETHTRLPGGWAILVSPKTTSIPIFWQLVLAEVGVDILRLALMFSPNSLAQSMGFFGAILLGDIAIKAGVLDAEVMVYVAIAAVGTFSAPDLDFGMAIRVCRMGLLIMVGILSLLGDPWLGLGLGLVVVVMLALDTDSFGIGYLWPLFPMDFAELTTVLIRKPLNRNVRRPSLTLPQDKRREAKRAFR